MAPFAQKVIRALFGAGELVAPASPAGSHSSCSAAPPTLPGSPSASANPSSAPPVSWPGAQAPPDDPHRPRDGVRVPAGAGRRRRHGAGHPWLGLAHRAHEGADRKFSRCRLPGRGARSSRSRRVLRPPPHHAARARCGEGRRRVVRAVRRRSSAIPSAGRSPANAVAGSVQGIAPLAAERLVLIAAPSSMPAIFEDFARFLNLGRKSYRAMASHVERITGRPLELRRLARIRADAAADAADPRA